MSLRAALSGRGAWGDWLVFVVTYPEQAYSYVWPLSSASWSPGSLLDVRVWTPFRQVFFNLMEPPFTPLTSLFSLWWDGVGLCSCSWIGVRSWGYDACVGFSCGQRMRKREVSFLLPLTSGNFVYSSSKFTLPSWEMLPEVQQILAKWVDELDMQKCMSKNDLWKQSNMYYQKGNKS